MRVDRRMIGYIIRLMTIYRDIIIGVFWHNRKQRYKSGERMEHGAPSIENLVVISGISVNVSNIMMIIVTAAIVLILSVLGARKLQMKPTGAQNVMEWILDFVKGIVNDAMDWKTGKTFLPLAITLFTFILVGNLLGVITTGIVNDEVWWKSPTADPGITLTLS